MGVEKEIFRASHSLYLHRLASLALLRRSFRGHWSFSPSGLKHEDVPLLSFLSPLELLAWEGDRKTSELQSHYSISYAVFCLKKIFFFFFNDTATTEIYTNLNTLSLHDALPIWSMMRASHSEWPEQGALPVIRASNF